MPHRSRLAALATVALGLTMVTGCSGGGSAAAPDDVWVSVYQPRPDVAAGRIAIQVHNDSGESLAIEQASLTSTYFAEDLEWPAGRAATVGPGRAIDLRVKLGDSDCTSDEATHTVTLQYRLGESDPQTATFAPVDDFHVLDLLHDAACLGERVSEVATLTAQSVAVPGDPGVPTELVIAVDPTGADGEVVIDSVTSTTLLAPFDGASGVGDVPLGITIDANGPSEIRIPLVPNRCDPHALAEDKVGTRIPLHVTAPDGTTGRLVLSATDELRAEMYAFFSSYCGLG